MEVADRTAAAITTFAWPMDSGVYGEARRVRAREAMRTHFAHVRRLILTLVLTWPVPAGAQTFLFETGWENAPSTGCSFENLTDNVTFTNDYGPANSCDTPIVEVVDDEMHSGSRSLRVNMLPGFGTNGPDFRIGHGFGANLSVAYLRWYQMFSPNYFFRQSDHKLVIWGPMDGAQHYYVNLRGEPGNTTARIALHVIPYDGLWESTNIAVTRGVWHLFEARIEYGNAGSLEVRVDGVPVQLVEQSPTGIDLSNFDPGAGIGYVKWDTTYNGYDDPAVQAATPFWTWIDDFAACSDTWCTTTGAGGSPTSSVTTTTSGTTTASATGTTGATSGAGGAGAATSGAGGASATPGETGEDSGCSVVAGVTTSRVIPWGLLVALGISRIGSNRRRRSRLAYRSWRAADPSRGADPRRERCSPSEADIRAS
jgi:hypothetical protein